MGVRRAEKRNCQSRQRASDASRLVEGLRNVASLSEDTGDGLDRADADFLGVGKAAAPLLKENSQFMTLLSNATIFEYSLQFENNAFHLKCRVEKLL